MRPRRFSSSSCFSSRRTSFFSRLLRGCAALVACLRSASARTRSAPARASAPSTSDSTLSVSPFTLSGGRGQQETFSTAPGAPCAPGRVYRKISPPPSSRSTRRAALSPPSIPFMTLRRAGVSTGHLFQSASASPRFSRDGQEGSEGSGTPSAPRKQSEAPSRRESFSQTSFAPSPSAAGIFSSAGARPPNMPAGMAPDTRSQSSRSGHRDTALRIVCPAAYLRRRITGAEGVLPAATRAGERNMKGSLCPGRKTSCALRPKPGREVKRSRLNVSTPSAGS